MYNNKLTMRSVKNTFEHVWSIPNCGIASIEKIIDRNGYTCGKFGWNANIYIVDNENAIATGDRPFGEPVPRELYQSYEKTARFILSNTEDYNKKVKAMKTLLMNLVRHLNEQ